MNDSPELENFKILRSIWKNTFDKILEIKVIIEFNKNQVLNKRSLHETKKRILDEDKKRIDEKFEKEYNAEFIANKMLD